MGATSLHTPAWNVLDLWALALDPEYLVEETVVPHASGRVTYPFNLDSATVTLTAWITGEVDPDGVQYSDDEQGFWANLNLFRTLITSAVSTIDDSDDGTKSATLATPTGDYTHPVIPGSLVFGRRKAQVMMGDGIFRRAWMVTFDVFLPLGTLVTADDLATMTIPDPVGPSPGCCDDLLLLTVNDIPMHTPAWNIHDLWDLTRDPNYRIHSRNVSGETGRATFPTKTDMLDDLDFDLWVAHDVYPDGSAAPDEMTGFWSNIMYLRRYVTRPVTTGDGTTECELDAPDGPFPFDARVFPLRFNSAHSKARMGDGEYRTASRATLTMDVPAGAVVA